MYVVDILQTNFYWLSLVAIGWAMLLAMANVKALPAGLRRGVSSVLGLHTFVIALASFACSVAVLGFVAIASYILHAPAVSFTIVYLSLLVASAGYATFYIRSHSGKLAQIMKLGVGWWKSRTVLAKGLFSLLVLAMVADFLFATIVKSFAGNSADTYVHLARIVSILHQGFNIQSGFFNGIPETGYHYNIIYALYVPPSHLFDMPYEVWEYSFGFFRILQWFAIFTLAWYVWKYWISDRTNTLIAASLSTLFAMATLSALFYTAIYPNQVINVWLVLLIIAISSYARGIKLAAWAALGLAFLCTTTHPTYSLMAAMFLVLVLLLRFILSKGRIGAMKNDVLLYGGLVATLMLGPLRTALFPYKLTTTQMSMGGFPTTPIGDLMIKTPDNVFTYPWTRFGLVFLGTCGFVFLLTRLWRQKKQWAIAAGLILFFPLVVYEPIGFEIANKLLPLWVIDRFTSMNILRLISVPLGVYAIAILLRGLNRRYKILRLPKGWKDFVWPLTVVGVLVLSACTVWPAYSLVKKNYAENTHYYRFMDRISADYGDTLKNEDVVLANTGDSYLLPAVLPVKVLAVEEGHTSPVADASNRLKCQTYAMSRLEYADLKTIGADYVLLAKYDPNYAANRAIADNRLYLKHVKESLDFTLYKVKSGSVAKKSDVHGPCYMYGQEEKSGHITR